METVTPQLEGSPERQYQRTGATITCYKVTRCTSLEPEVCDEPLFTITAPTEGAAQAIMEDLYYGEYTGG